MKDEAKKDEIVLSLDSIKQDINLLLEEREFLEYSFEKEVKKKDQVNIENVKAIVYLVEKDIFKQFESLEVKAKLIQNIPLDAKKKKGLYSIVSMPNINKPIYKVESFFLKHKYLTVTDPNKCFTRAKADYTIFKRTKIKNLNSYINQNSFSIDEQNKLKFALDNELKILDEKVLPIIDDENKDKYKFLVTSFKEHLKYPHLYCNYMDPILNKSAGESFYLRTDVPNVLLFKELEGNKEALNDFRANAKVKQFINNAELLYKDVYYQEIKE